VKQLTNDPASIPENPVHLHELKRAYQIVEKPGNDYEKNMVSGRKKGEYYHENRY